MQAHGADTSTMNLSHTSGLAPTNDPETCPINISTSNLSIPSAETFQVKCQASNLVITRHYFGNGLSYGRRGQPVQRGGPIRRGCAEPHSALLRPATPASSVTDTNSSATTPPTGPIASTSYSLPTKPSHPRRVFRNPRPIPSSTADNGRIESDHAQLQTPMPFPKGTLYVKCKALEGLRQDSETHLIVANAVVAQVTSAILDGIGDKDEAGLEYRGIRWPTKNGHPWIMLKGPVGAQRRLACLSWYLRTALIEHLSVIPEAGLLGSTIIFEIAGSPDAVSLYEALEHTRPYLIRMGHHEGLAVPTAVQYLFRAETSRSELHRIGRFMMRQIGQVTPKILVLCYTVPDTKVQSLPPVLLGKEHAYTAPTGPVPSIPFIAVDKGPTPGGRL